jgi:hypothetical protein
MSDKIRALQRQFNLGVIFFFFVSVIGLTGCAYIIINTDENQTDADTVGDTQTIKTDIGDQ